MTLFRSVSNRLGESYLSSPQTKSSSSSSTKEEKKEEDQIIRPSIDEPAHIYLAHSIPLSILNHLPQRLKRYLRYLNPILNQDYFQSYEDDSRFDPIASSPKPSETPYQLIKEVLGFGHDQQQLDPLWDPQLYSNDLLIWWIMSHLFLIYLLAFQVFIRRQAFSRLNVSTARVWEI